MAEAVAGAVEMAQPNGLACHNIKKQLAALSGTETDTCSYAN